MASKFTKFLSFTAVLSAAAAAGYVLYKKHADNKGLIDDFDDDFDDFDDDFDDLDSEDRGYTSIHPEDLSDDAEEDEPESGLSDTLTEDEKEALSDTETFSAKEEKEENTEEEE